jgi:hypothetical protein
MGSVLLWGLTLLVFVLPGVGCAPASINFFHEERVEPMSDVIGNWQKMTQSACSSAYPDHIEFQAGGLYFTQKASSSIYTQWDAGTYEVVNLKQIKISTANDAVITYQFSIAETVVTFVDPQGCEFQYRRL